MNKNISIYIAPPYSCTPDDPKLRQYRVDCCKRAFVSLWKQGYRRITVPLIGSHYIYESYPDMGGDWEAWKDRDEWLLDNVDVLVILMLDGW